MISRRIANSRGKLHRSRLWRQGTAPKARFEPISGALECPEILSGHSYFLGSYIDHQGINQRIQLDDAISGGFIEKDGQGGFKFVHDKVREAAYNLIPISDKNQVTYETL
eukprot:scaffold949_cov160-Skeletonema_dohrnii-CCMP3373.AAC.3